MFSMWHFLAFPFVVGVAVATPTTKGGPIDAVKGNCGQRTTVGFKEAVWIRTLDHAAFKHLTMLPW